MTLQDPHAHEYRFRWFQGISGFLCSPHSTKKIYGFPHRYPIKTDKDSTDSIADNMACFFIIKYRWKFLSNDYIP